MPESVPVPVAKHPHSDKSVFFYIQFIFLMAPKKASTQKPKKFSPPPSKEACSIVVDLSSDMNNKGDKILEEMKIAISTLVKLKIQYSSKDEIAIIVNGAKNTKNLVNDAWLDKAKQIEVVQPMGVCSLDYFDVINSLSFQNTDAHISEAIEVGLNLIISRVKKLKFNKRIICFTTSSNKLQTLNQKLLDELIENECKLNLILDDMSESRNPLISRLKNLSENSRGYFILSSLRESLESLSFFRTKKTLPRTTFRGVLDISPSLGVKIWCYKKSDDPKIPLSLKTTSNSLVDPVLNLKNEGENGEKDGTLRQRGVLTGGVINGSGKVQRELTYISLDNPDERIDEEQIVKGYRYGKDFVSVDKNFESSLKYKTEPELTLLGFTDRSRIPRHHFMGFLYQVISEPYDLPASLAFSSIVKACLDLDQVLIVRYVYRANLAPHLSVLLPYSKEVYDGFYMVDLPFAEDIRNYPFRSFESIKHNEEQLEAAEQLISSMDMMNIIYDEDLDGPVEFLKPTEVFNPVLQQFYENLHLRAMNGPDYPLPKDLDPAIAKACLPEKSPDSPYFALLKMAEVSLKKFEKNFKLVKQEAKAQQKKFWFSLDGKLQQAIQDLSLTSYNAPIIPKQEEGLADASMERQRIQDKIDLDLISMKTANVRTIDPVKDFREILARKDIDLVDRAIQQMKQVILKFIRDSIGDQYYGKCLDCLKELRNGCCREEEAEKFNEFLKELKAQFSEDPIRAEFWQLLVRDHITLINENEAKKSNVTPEEADKFLLEKQERTYVLPEKKQNEDELFGELE